MPANGQPGLRPAIKLAALLAVVALIAVVISRIRDLGDYGADAGPAIDALAAGNISGFFHAQPLMGSFSVLLRAPFAALGDLLGANALNTYRLEAIPVLAGAAALGLYISKLMGEREQPQIARVVVVALLIAGPMTLEAFRAGHPEEVLGATLCVAAVVAALRDSTIWAAVLLGLALATKQWAVLAIGPVLVALAGQRWRAMLIAGALALTLTLPLAFGNSQSFQTNTRNAANTYGASRPYSIWRPFSTRFEREVDLGGAQKSVVVGHRLPNWVGRVSHPLIVLLALPLTLAFWMRRRSLRREDALLLLALLFLLRCLLDPVNNFYYNVPFIFSITAWESLRLRGLPLIGVATSLMLWFLPNRGAAFAEISGTTIYLCFMLPLLAWILVRLYAPGTLERLHFKGGRVELPSHPLVA